MAIEQFAAGGEVECDLVLVMNAARLSALWRPLIIRNGGLGWSTTTVEGGNHETTPRIATGARRDRRARRRSPDRSAEGDGRRGPRNIRLRIERRHERHLCPRHEPRNR